MKSQKPVTCSGLYRESLLLAFPFQFTKESHVNNGNYEPSTFMKTPPTDISIY